MSETKRTAWNDSWQLQWEIGMLLRELERLTYAAHDDVDIDELRRIKAAIVAAKKAIVGEGQ